VTRLGQGGTKMRSLTMRLAALLLIGLIPAREAAACVNDSECKGERICSKSICSAPPATATATMKWRLGQAQTPALSAAGAECGK